MSILDTKCAQCGSKEHATEDCPHGIFSGNKCAQCGSTDHATEDCPHGIFSGNKCAQCGSTEHATEDCPHGIFSGAKCAQCGSTEHATENCPHGIFSGNKCAHCGSKNHSTEQCPQLNPRVQEDTEGGKKEGGITDWLAEKGALIGGVIGAIAGFSEAVGSADGVSGYLIYTAIGAVGGSMLGGLMAALLPWAIGAAVLMLILKACGMG